MRTTARIGVLALTLCLAVTPGRAAPAAGAEATTVYSEDFANGLPGNWEGGTLLTDGLPKGAKGGALTTPGADLKSNHAWANGHFTVENGLYLNYWARFDDPQWYQAFVFCKAPGQEAKDMNLYEAKPPVAAAAGQWQCVSLPFADFRGTTGPNQGHAPKPGEVCWMYFWSFQKRTLGMAVARVWVTRGKPAAAAAAPPPAAAAAEAAPGVATWAFAPNRDTFSPDAQLDLRSLNEDTAGQGGWVRIDPEGDFVRGDGQPLRFWAINTGVEREQPFQRRPLWKAQAPDIGHHARWLAKRGVNLVRCHAHINPDLKANPQAAISDTNAGELAYIWRTVGAMKKAGIYTIVSPYWANTMQSDDGKWGTDWQGNHHALLFFEPALQAAYKAWLRQLFATPTPLLGGKTLAQEPALAVFQIQNEDSLLFWTVQNLKGGPKQRLGRLFGDWAAAKYGSLDQALAAWKGERLPEDNLAAGVLDLKLVWHMTADARVKNAGQGPRLNDQLAFWTETMVRFNRMVAAFVRDELKCPVLVNAGNWHTADTVLLNDPERYSYTANEVLAVNRYFGGVHKGPQAGWAIINGDQFTSDSALTDAALSFPLNLKQATGRPMLVTEGAWVFPNAFAAEGPFLISVYSGLTGVDAYVWFATGTEEWTPPQSANGYLPSQQKWICATPDMLGQFPAAALAFRRGYVRRGPPAVEEHRSLQAMWERRTPILAESAAFDPNRDAGDVAPASPVKTGIDPYAFLAGPVTVTYDSSEANTKVADLAPLVRHRPDGVAVTSTTGEVELNTAEGFCTVNAPKCQGVAAHFARRGTFDLRDVSVTAANAFGTVMLVPLDDQPLASSARVLVQVGMPCRPTGWKAAATTVAPEGGKPTPGWRVVDYGRAPWAVEVPNVRVTVRNPKLTRGTVLDANGQARGPATLDRGVLTFPADALYVVLHE